MSNIIHNNNIPSYIPTTDDQNLLKTAVNNNIDISQSYYTTSSLIEIILSNKLCYNVISLLVYHYHYLQICMTTTKLSGSVNESVKE